jgi:hypothetical protein
LPARRGGERGFGICEQVKRILDGQDRNDDCRRRYRKNADLDDARRDRRLEESRRLVIPVILDPSETRPSGWRFLFFFRIGEEERHGVV